MRVVGYWTLAILHYSGSDLIASASGLARLHAAAQSNATRYQDHEYTSISPGITTSWGLIWGFIDNASTALLITELVTTVWKGLPSSFMNVWIVAVRTNEHNKADMGYQRVTSGLNCRRFKLRFYLSLSMIAMFPTTGIHVKASIHEGSRQGSWSWKTKCNAMWTSLWLERISLSQRW